MFRTRSVKVKTICKVQTFSDERSFQECVQEYSLGSSMWICHVCVISTGQNTEPNK